MAPEDSEEINDSALEGGFREEEQRRHEKDPLLDTMTHKGWWVSSTAIILLRPPFEAPL